MTDTTTPTHNILLVEDEPTFALWITRILEGSRDTNFKVTHFDNLKQATASVSEGTYNLVILDLNLPDASGLETVAKMAMVSFPTTPVIVATATDDDQMATKAITAGFKAYLVKEALTPERLLETVTKVLNIKPSA